MSDPPEPPLGLFPPPAPPGLTPTDLDVPDAAWRTAAQSRRST